MIASYLLNNIDNGLVAAYFMRRFVPDQTLIF